MINLICKGRIYFSLFRIPIVRDILLPLLGGQSVPEGSRNPVVCV